MKKFFAPLLMLSMLMLSCSEDDVIKEVEEPETGNLEVERFIYRGMNDIYLYKSEVPALANDYFSSSTEKDDFLATFDSPEELYEDLQANHDIYSFMTADYVALTKRLKGGVSKSNGMDYQLHLLSNSSDEIYGYVRYVVPGTSADEKGVKRGDFFTEVDGQDLTISNYQSLLGKDSYTLKISKLEGNTITPTDKTVDLVKVEASEDPVLITDVLEIEGNKIGYLMYNGFTPSFDERLNDAFAEFKAQNLTHFVLDLRYNSGGSGRTAIDLASMISGQLYGEVMMKYYFNEEYQVYYEKNYPAHLVERFNNEIRTGARINSLNLTEVYVLTTKGSASASEFVINGLDPYINVVQIGDYTSGKYQASLTLYDSPNFKLADARANRHVNENHTYAIQPLVLKYANVKGVTDFRDGLEPDIFIQENLSDLGTLGDPSEKLLEAAINAILGIPQEEATATQKRMSVGEFKFVGESKMFEPGYQKLIIDDLPIIPRPQN